MSLHDYWLRFRKHLRVVAACLLVALLAAAVLTMFMPRAYSSRTEIFVSTRSTSNAGGVFERGQFAQQQIKSYLPLVNSPPVMSAVVVRLGLPLAPAQLAKKVTTAAPAETVLIDITVRDSSAAGATRIAEATADEFIRLVSSLEAGGAGQPSAVTLSVVRPAQFDPLPVSPRPGFNLALAIIAGLAVGVGAAAVRVRLDTTVYSRDDVAAVTSLAPLVTIASDRGARRRPLLSALLPGSRRHEDFRRLRSSLESSGMRLPATILVTSPNPGDGKTTTTVNLAIVLAQSGRRVAVVDGDLRNPEVQSYLGTDGKIGVSSILSDGRSLDEALLSWKQGLLAVLPSGPTVPFANELLSSPEFGRVLAALQQDFDVVLLDSPPVLSVADATVLARVADRVLLVVRSGQTERRDLKFAIESLEAAHGRVPRVLLNRADGRREDASYAKGATAAPGRKVIPLPTLQGNRAVRRGGKRGKAADSPELWTGREA